MKLRSAKGGQILEPPTPFDLCKHDGKRDVGLQPQWRVGERVAVARLETAEYLVGRAAPPGTRPRLYTTAGTVVESASDQPAGGCAVSVTVKLDGERDLHAYPDFNQILFYGDYGRELLDYCKLFGIQGAAV